LFLILKEKMVRRGNLILTALALTGLLMQILSPTESVQLVTTSALRPESPSSSSSSSIFDETADYDTQKYKRKAMKLKLKIRRMKLRQAEFELE
jgi:hypothetical protein